MLQHMRTRSSLPCHCCHAVAVHLAQSGGRITRSQALRCSNIGVQRFALQGPFEVHYCQPQPRFRPVAAHALQREQPDIAAPRFSRCTTPVVFWPFW